MKLRRLLYENEIDFIVGNRIDIKIKARVIEELYGAMMNVIVTVLNDESTMEYPERINAAFDEMEDGQRLKELFSETVFNWTGEMRQHFLMEGNDDRIRYKFVKSPIKGPGAIDEVIIDFDRSFANLPYEEPDYEAAEVVNDAPDSEDLNAFFDSLDRTEQVTRVRTISR